MATNKDLIASIEAEATAKGLDIPVTEGLNNEQLAATLKTLKGPAAPAPAAPKNKKDEDEVKLPALYVCKGKAITSPVGMLAEGDAFKLEYVAGDKERIKELVKLGVLAKG